MNVRFGQRCLTGLDDRCPDHTLVAMDPPVMPLRLVIESGAALSAEQPVTIGVPFPRGVYTDGLVPSLSDELGRDVPLQTTPLARWSDGSVKWLLVDFICRPRAKRQETWSLELHHKIPRECFGSEQQLGAVETERGVIVETGWASFVLDREVLAPIVQAEIDGVPILDATRTQTVLFDVQGHSRRPQIERFEIETNGPVRATVRFDGSFEGRRRDRCRFCARLSFFAGTSLVRVELTLRNPSRARHRGGLWDLGDPGSIYFRDLSLRLGIAGSDVRGVQWTEDIDAPELTTEAETFEIFQDSSGGENWGSRNHVNRLGEVPCRFRGYRVRQGGNTSFGLRASPVVSVHGHAGTVTAAIPEFWQQFPKAIDTTAGTLNLRLFPGQFGDLFELQGGEQKTHTIWLHFKSVDRPEIDSLEWAHRPARIHCTPDWYARTEVVPYLAAASANASEHFESYLSAVVDGPTSFFARREIIDEYGWRNYGDVYADHEGAYYLGETPVISHYNNQYDSIHGFLIQFFRTGNARWFDLADPLARHVSDIDIYHTDQDRAAYNGGQFWHTDHYRDAATSTHRAYSCANRGRDASGYGGGPSNEHNYTTGLLHYYYLTGNPQARDAVLGLAGWVLNREDGYKTVLGLVDSEPTGLASATTHPDYHGPGRGCGNSINALLDGWLLTRSRTYLEKAESLIRRSVHPALDVAALDLLDTEVRWSYTVFLSVMARYLGLKAEFSELDGMYAYARASLLAIASWMVDNEVPYFDRPEKLEYPTETWAAQEFRKANVLRLTAQYTDEPLRSRLIARGRELADRAWSDLIRFPSREVARAVAILMVEGTRDSYWREHPIKAAPVPTDAPDFGPPHSFVAQKRRVLDRLKTPRGALQALIGLSNVRRWRRFLSRRIEIRDLGVDDDFLCKPKD
jgi:hypothetical protein